LTDEPYQVQKDQLFGTASKVEVIGLIFQSVQDGEGLKVNAVKGMAAFKVTEGDTEHINCFFEALPTELSEGQRAEAVEFLRRNVQVFSKSEFDVGQTDLVELKIETPDSRPVRQALRRHPVAYLLLIDD